MSSNYDSVLPPQQSRHTHSESRRHFPSFFTSIKSLVRRPWLPNRSPSRPGSCKAKRPEWEISQSDADDRQSLPSLSTPLRSRIHPRPRDRRRHVSVTSVADYLTLAQLENFWRQQDSHREMIIARVPLETIIASTTSLSRGPEASSWSHIHPALRPGPTQSHENSKARGNRCKMSTPTTRRNQWMIDPWQR